MSMPVPDRASSFLPEIHAMRRDLTNIIAVGVVASARLFSSIRDVQYGQLSVETEDGATSTEERYFTEEFSIERKTPPLPVLGYDGIFATTPTVHNRLNLRRGAASSDGRRAVSFNVYGSGRAHSRVPGERITLKSDGSVQFGALQPFFDDLPLTLLHKGMTNPTIEKLRLVQNIIHLGNRASLAAIGFAAVNTVAELPNDVILGTNTLQRRCAEVFESVTGRATTSLCGEEYRPGLHVSVLAPYAVVC